MLKLYGFASAHGIYDLSPFVTKVATWLRMNGVEFETAAGNPRVSPKGKLPCIDHDGVVLSDSSFIIDHCAKAFGKDMDAGLSERDRALGTAIKSMVEEHLYFTTLYLRWKDPRGWVVMKPSLVALAATLKIPGPMRGIVAEHIRKSALKRLEGQGVAKHSISEVERMAGDLFDALAGLLGEQEFMLGGTPRTVDATVWAALDGIRKMPIENEARARLLANEKLMAYCDRIEKRYWSK